MIGAFHFLRPEWLWPILAAALLAWLVARIEDARSRWRGLIAPHLLDHLIVQKQSRLRIRPVHLTIALIVLGAIAAAGPTWDHERSPFVEDKAPLAIAIDLSPTMDAIDISPSRLERAKLKVRDLLKLRPGARTAIFAYGGSAHLVLPLTDDANLIQTYVDALATRIMPVSGAGAAKDTAKAVAVVEAALAREETPGTILLMTDGVEPRAHDALKGRNGRNELMLLAFGTAEGGPVRTGQDQFLTNATGARVFSKLDLADLRKLKSEAGLALATVTPDDADMRWIARSAQSHLEQQQAKPDGQERWRDMGWWLVLPIAVLSALWFRRGWTISWGALALLFMVMAAPERAQAAELRFADLWLTPDQQGRLAFDRKDYDAAASHFANPFWKGVAAYRAGRFEDAVDAFARIDSAESYYNQGNALAQLGKLPEAAASYGEALKRRASWTEAKHNLDIVQTLIDARKKDDEQQAQDPTFKADEVQFDDKAKQGKRGEVPAGQQTTEMWMRNIQTTPTDLLARRFAIEARGATP
ncbi:VWA domain-containing protein [Bosea lathyri]|uniref:Ca-activated chloride channel family protein n=1 Tax=Bosea lathyri TaxID=1036778 RepID=A0A1H5UXH7_9HYPH|nr:VWA domain-containing protein [Bosea lathyri]SEF79795.1 Ca-activated chloride channel family protein [Bosea lathyri]